MSRRRGVRRPSLIVVALVVGIVGITAAPRRRARARRDSTPTNYETKLRSVSPPRAGLHVRSHRSRHEGRAHQRRPPRGGRARLRGRAVPARRPEGRLREPPLPRDVPQPVDARSAARHRSRRHPRPHRCGDSVSTGTTAIWHDHRAALHGRRPILPPSVQRDPDTPPVVDNLVIPMRVGTVTRQAATARSMYVPPPSPWPCRDRRRSSLAVLVFVLRGRPRWRTVFVVALAAADASPRSCT